MFGRLSEEIEVKVAASEAWKVFGSIELAHLAFRQLSDIIQKMEVLEGDGGSGTIIKLTFPGNLSNFMLFLVKLLRHDFLDCIFLNCMCF